METDADRLVAVAEERFAAGLLIEAEAVCQQVVRLVPGHPRAVFLKGLMALAVGNANIARARFHALRTADAGLARLGLGLLAARPGEGMVAAGASARLLQALHCLEEGRFKAFETLVAQGGGGGHGPSGRFVPQLHGLAAIARAAAARSPAMVDFLRERAVYQDAPRRLTVETIGRCNARCGFCPNQTLERGNTVMSDRLFARIVEQLADWPRDVPSMFLPNNINEPFMDRALFDRLLAVRCAAPHMGFCFYTNLNVFPAVFEARIDELAPIVGFNVSFNAACRAEYEAVMQVSFDRTVANIRRVLSLNRRVGFLKGRVVLSRVADHSPADDRFPADCAALFPEFEAEVEYIAKCKPRADWLGEVATAPSPVPNGLPCGAWLDISVNCDGKVPHCCLDASVRYPWGDVGERSILEIYNAPAFRRLRERKTAREGIFPCETCPQIT